MNKIKLKNKLTVQLAQAEDPKARFKLKLFLAALGKEGVVRACHHAGKAPRFYYYWWNRYRDADFQLAALAEKSRRPKGHPNAIPAAIRAQIAGYAAQFREGPEKIRRRLERDHQVCVSKSTVYRLLHSRPGTRRRSAPGQRLPASPPATIPTSPGALREFAGRYLIQRELGRGAAGVVYLAQDRRAENRTVALKTLAADARDTEWVESLRNEFRALAALRHSNLARVYDFGAAGGELYFSSEYIAGRDFLSVAREANLNTVFRLFVQILRALDFLHARGILHLDLKPSNILVAEGETDPEIKLIDFGGVRERDQGLEGGAFAGTPPYSAPELLLGQTPSPASDLYALGMLAHQVFAGAFPFSSQDPVDWVKEQVYGEPLRAGSLHPALPEAFSEILLRLVAKDPAARFSSAREVVEALNRCLGENFSLRGPREQARLLDSCDYQFHEASYQTLREALEIPGPRVLVLSGPAGTGKSRLLTRLKHDLQLRGAHPLFLETRESLQDALRDKKSGSDEALLIDGIAFDADELVLHLDLLENLQRPVLLATELPKRPEYNPHRWIELSRLDGHEVTEFLVRSIAGFPAGLGEECARLCGGELEGLEALLQALTEEGLVQDSEQGWRWVAEIAVSPALAWERQGERWASRRRQAMDWLRFSEAGLQANTLAGVLAVPTTRLAPRLAAWEQEGWLRARRRRGELYYYFRQEQLRPAPGREPRDWDWAGGELERRYERGQYAQGVELYGLVRTEAGSGEAIPLRVALAGARLQVAAGWAEAALESLPKSPPTAAAELGLFHEIAARAHFLLGRLQETDLSLQAGEAAYKGADDRLGLSRLANLRGSWWKRKEDMAQAEQAFIRAVRLAAEGEDAYHEAIAWMNLAILRQDLGDWREADQTYARAFEREAGIDQPLLACKLRNNRINLLLYLGRSQEAEAECYEFLKVALRARYPDQQASALGYLALLAGQKNDRAGQLRHLEQALSLIQPRQHPQLYFQCMLDRGQLQYATERYAAAQIDAECAEQAARRSANPTWLALAQLLLGKIFRDRPKPQLDTASRLFNEAHHAAWKQKNLSLLWELDFERGRLAQRRGETERARNYLRTAKATLEKLLAQLPEAARNSYLRDRKGEHLEAAWRQLPP